MKLGTVDTYLPSTYLKSTIGTQSIGLDDCNPYYLCMCMQILSNRMTLAPEAIVIVKSFGMNTDFPKLKNRQTELAGYYTTR